MLDKKRPLDENAVATIIGPGTIIEGNVKSKGTIRIEGEVHGCVECEDTIVVQESGQVSADLIAGQVIISGTVQGNTVAHDRLEITNQGKVIGNIAAPRISIAEGVIFEGTCTMKPPGEATRLSIKEDTSKAHAQESAGAKTGNGQGKDQNQDKNRDQNRDKNRDKNRDQNRAM